MGFFFKKRIKLCKGVNLNLSKNGVGISYGIKGFRVSHNSKGQSYINAGRHGFYYRKSLKNNRNKKSNIQVGFENANKMHESYLTYLHLLKDVKGDWEFSVFEPSDYILEDLVYFHKFKSGFFKYLAWGLFIFGFLFPPLWLVDIALLVWVSIESKKYLIKPQFEIIQSLSLLMDKMSDNFIMHNALTNEELPWGIIFTKNLFNCKVPFVNLKSYNMCFIDTGILFYSDTIVFCVPYEKWSIAINDTTALMINPPEYAKVISTTYEHVNKNGSPNKRYKNNREIQEISAYVLCLSYNDEIVIPLTLFDKENAYKLYENLKKIIGKDEK